MHPELWPFKPSGKHKSHSPLICHRRRVMPTAVALKVFPALRCNEMRRPIVHWPDSGGCRDAARMTRGVGKERYIAGFIRSRQKRVRLSRSEQIRSLF